MSKHWKYYFSKETEKRGIESQMCPREPEGLPACRGWCGFWPRKRCSWGIFQHGRAWSTLMVRNQGAVQTHSWQMPRGQDCRWSIKGREGKMKKEQTQRNKDIVNHKIATESTNLYLQFILTALLFSFKNVSILHKFTTCQ